MTSIPFVKLNNGLEMPIFGLGTWQGSPGKEDEVAKAVKVALELGYKLIDCAHFYANEKAIGDAIQEKVQQGVVRREDLFVTSKLWCNSHHPESVGPALKTTLKNLQLDALDLYLMHWPQGYKEGSETMPKDPETGKILYSDVDYVDTWEAMEEVYHKGLTKAIGVSNFNSKQLDRLLGSATVVPQVHQIECHPYLNQKKLRRYCEEHGIIVTSYSPLGGPRENVKPGDPDVLNDPKIKEIATRYGKSPGQVLLKYNIQLGNVVIPKSANRERLEENIKIFDFALAPEDMAYINTFDCNGRVCRNDEVKEHVHYPFKPEIEF